MGLARRPRFTYGVSDLSLTYPVRAWMPADATVGSRNVSATGIPAAYIVRRDVLIDLTLRFTEDEWEAVLALIAFGQTSQAFRWYPDALDTDEEYDSVEVYLEAPGPGERFAPTRDGQYPRMFEMAITLRGVGGVLPFRAYFDT